MVGSRSSLTTNRPNPFLLYWRTDAGVRKKQAFATEEAREAVAMVLDLQLAAPADVQARNSIVAPGQRVQLLNSECAHPPEAAGVRMKAVKVDVKSQAQRDEIATVGKKRRLKAT